MRSLSESQASRCEAACQPRCKCRCHGAAHGARRNRAAGVADGNGDAKGQTLDCQCLEQMENHTHPRECGCICHVLMRAFFEALPADDPHHLPTEAERKQHRRHRRSGTTPITITAPEQHPQLTFA